ncbi:MAG TPA: hypothetical protein PLS49_00525, partial [Candidatus Woesebacteria bacterium]|nr:hypothetical protein [Candidatus Woesebacteria bacterium]
FTDSRPIFKSSDFITIFNVLLKGKLVYTPEVLFYKRDTGLFTKQFAVIKTSLFDSVVLKKIKRYMYFPLFFIYDFWFGLLHLVKSDFPFTDKIKVAYYLLRNTVYKYIQFVLNIMRAIIAVIR